MFLFTRVLIVDCQMAQGAAAQVARVEMASGVLVALAVCWVVHGMGMVMTVAGVDVEIAQAGEGGERIRQHLSGVGAESGVEFGAQVEPALALERLEEVGVVWAEGWGQRGERLQNPPATVLGCEAALNAEAQPAGIGQFGAMALMNAAGKQVESW